MRFYKVPISIIIGPYGNIPKRIGLHIIMSVMISIGIMIFQGHTGIDWFFKVFTMSITNDLIMSSGHIWIFYNLDQNFDWLKQTWARFSTGVIFHTVYSSLAFFATQLVLFHFLFGMSMKDTTYWFVEYWWLPVVITGLVIVFTTTVGFFQNWKKSLVEEEKMKAEMMVYKFESLKGQINPSFLFDSFDALKRLIEKDEQQSVQVIQKMSRLYRIVLENKDTELVPLKEELKLLEIYRELLELRFGAGLSLKLNIEASKSDAIVPMALQGVIEKLLPQGKKTGPQEISLIKKEAVVEIRSNGQSHLSMSDLENLNRRYEFFTERRIEIIEGEETVVQIPILTEES